MLNTRPLRIGAVAPILLSAIANQSIAADYTLGAGAAWIPQYEGSDDYEAQPNWLLSVDDLYHPDTYVRLSGPSLRSNFVPDPHLRAGVSGQWVRERDDVDDDAVDRLDSTDTAVLLGGIFGWDFLAEPSIELTAAIDLRYDVANDNGYLITPRLIYFNSLPDSRFSVGTELFANWASEDYMSEQFGISPSEAARSGLDAYDPDADFKDVGAGVIVNYRFTDHLSATGRGTYSRLVGDAANSPIVEDGGDENQFFVGATLNYHF